MLNFGISIAAGLFCGIISGFGIGGGSLLMVWMTAVCAIEQKTAQGINLLYFLPTAAAALILHSKNKQVEWRAVLPAALCGGTAACLLSWIAIRVEGDLLQKFFGSFLIIIGLSELFKKPKNNRSVTN